MTFVPRQPWRRQNVLEQRAPAALFREAAEYVADRKMDDTHFLNIRMQQVVGKARHGFRAGRSRCGGEYVFDQGLTGSARLRQAGAWVRKPHSPKIAWKHALPGHSACLCAHAGNGLGHVQHKGSENRLCLWSLRKGRDSGSAQLRLTAFCASIQALASSRASVPSYNARPLIAPTRLVVRVRG